MNLEYKIETLIEIISELGYIVEERDGEIYLKMKTDEDER